MSHNDMPRYTGPQLIDRSHHDGRLPWAVGAQCRGVFRVSRRQPHDKQGRGADYNHQPYLAHWRGLFWLHYLGGPSDEQHGVVDTYVTWSADGHHWEPPEVIFPSVKLEGRWTRCHQRMGWYIAKDGRLLAMAFHGHAERENDGTGYARLVREVYEPGRYGPIYALKFGRNRTEASTGWTLFERSDDQGFVAACREFLDNKLLRQQWYEEDQDDPFYVFAPGHDMMKQGRAFSFYRLPDNRIVGMWKSSMMTVADEWEFGKMPPPVGDAKRFGEHSASKMFGQRTSDGRYAMVASLGRDVHRNPLAVCTSKDGLDFNGEWLVIHGDVPPQRYVNPRNFSGAPGEPLEGDNKDSGAQYVTRITEGNGEPLGGAMWLTYSVNKEDIWVAEVPVPIRGSVEEDVRDDFENMTPSGPVVNWNIYAPAWCPVDVAAEIGNQFLRLQDWDPYNYAKAVRVFPKSRKVSMKFRIRAHQKGHGRLEIDVTDRRGQRAIQMILDSEAGCLLARAGMELKELWPTPVGEWLEFGIEIDASAGVWSLVLKGQAILNHVPLSADVTDVERLEFRTGEYRQDDFSRLPEDGSHAPSSKEDGKAKADGYVSSGYRHITNVLANADVPDPNAIFDIDDVIVTRLV
jgi:hypothetical protein